VVRDAWDCVERLATITKNSPTRATRPYVSIIGHITADELRQTLDHASMANGYANRFLFACVRRNKLLPHGGTFDDAIPNKLGTQTFNALTTARNIGQVTMTPAAWTHWDEIYPKLSEGAPGLIGAIIGRAEAQTVRLALLYALLDQAQQIDIVHLDAGLALWNYSEASARYVFGDLVGDPVADSILRALRHAGTTGMTRTDISTLFSRNLSATRIEPALALLMMSGKAKPEKRIGTGGRAKEVWFAL
jgi:hypothetical protein